MNITNQLPSAKQKLLSLYISIAVMCGCPVLMYAYDESYTGLKKRRTAQDKQHKTNTTRRTAQDEQHKTNSKRRKGKSFTPSPKIKV